MEYSDDSQDKLFICPFPRCGKRFKTKFSMCRHNLVHSQEKNYSCKYCGKKFALYQYLKEHTNTHTSEKPYVCGVSGCQERFSQTGKLSLHRRTHPEYKLKKYHANSEYNKAKQRSSESHSSSSAKSPRPKRASRKTAETRKDGQPRKEKVNVEEEYNAPPSIYFGHSHDNIGLQTSATREPVELNVTMPLNLEDPFVRYLTYLPYTSVSTVRPVLPVPRKMEGRKCAVRHCIPLNLFELLSKSAN